MKTVTRFYRHQKQYKGWTTSQKIKWTKECQHHGTHPQTLLVDQLRNLQRKVELGKHSCFTPLPERTEIAKYAREPRLQGLLAGNALVKQYLEQTSLVA